MNDGELYRKISKVIRGSSPLTIHEVIEEAKEEYEQITDKAFVAINATNKVEVLFEYTREKEAWGKKWLGR